MLTSWTGASGLNTMPAPDPAGEKSESPKALLATTFDTMLSLSYKLKGLVLNAANSITHFKVVSTSGLVQVACSKKVTPLGLM